MNKEERFWSKVERRTARECWPWIASRFHFGHGQVGIGGKHTTAHRIAWELTNGAIPDGLCVLHSCDNPPCCNPRHLFLGTRGDNAQDRKNKRRTPTGEKNINAKLTETEVRAMFVMERAGYSISEIAAIVQTTYSNVQNILDGRRWSHLKLKRINKATRKVARKRLMGGGNLPEVLAFHKNTQSIVS